MSFFHYQHKLADIFPNNFKPQTVLHLPDNISYASTASVPKAATLPDDVKKAAVAVIGRMRLPTPSADLWDACLRNCRCGRLPHS